MKVVDVGFNFAFFGFGFKDFGGVVDVEVVAYGVGAGGHFVVVGEAEWAHGTFGHGVGFAVDDDGGLYEVFMNI